MKNLTRTALALAAAIAALPPARADVITDWNIKAGAILAESKMGTPPAVRAMAIVQTAAADAVEAVGRRPGFARNGGALEAAVAAAHRVTLLKLMPAQEASIQAAYQAALAALPDTPARAAGIAAGEQAAAAVLAARADDGAAAPDRFASQTSAGHWVPTAAAAASTWPQRKPWLLQSPAQFRPPAPPALTSPTWQRDLAEVKALGARASTTRTPEQTAIGRFWDYSLPPVYHGVVRSVALAPGRDVARNARLFATVAQAMDDAMIAVFEAKYHYRFWRPVTAIRQGAADAGEAGWVSLIDAPMHPEYPSAHSILASTVGTILQAEVGSAAMPELATSSPTAQGATRRWASVDDFVNEVSVSRIYGGIHYRFSTEVGTAMGKQVGALAAQRQAAGGL
ncbi:MAG: vanadium-dependent haloperoxidase [Piscinibacter sp.]|uniref:vanadium-dependent haloperoxidase n=1 Tax=Piscinibacter sp. TaxID=1903157 RepID=UPI002590A805|nr:vanadium-dependent haloperoxidase [Piscinibacter sp.]MCW5666086.1 vanadium-dependent haloperoxidase [Piscinibacter sp.]